MVGFAHLLYKEGCVLQQRCLQIGDLRLGNKRNSSSTTLSMMALVLLAHSNLFTVTCTTRVPEFSTAVACCGGGSWYAQPWNFVVG